MTASRNITRLDNLDDVPAGSGILTRGGSIAWRSLNKPFVSGVPSTIPSKLPKTNPLPTLTVLAADAATTMTNSQRWYPGHDAFAPINSYVGYGPSYPDNFNYISQVPLSNAGTVKSNGPVCWEFECYLDSFELVIKEITAQFRVLVNDTVAHAADFLGTNLSSTGSEKRYKFVFGSYDFRRITIQGASNFVFGGIETNRINSIFPTTRNHPIRAAFIGDSYTEGTGTGGTLGFPTTAAALLGWGWPMVFGLGSTGYIEPGVPNITFSQRTSEVIRYNPDILVFCGGINDSTRVGIAGNASAVQTAATSLIQTYQTALPNVQIYVVGPFYPADPSGAPSILQIHAALKAAALAKGLLFIPTLDYIQYITDPWIRGTGRTWNHTNDGNADLLSGNGTNDSTHPDQNGHDYLGLRIAGTIAKSYRRSDL